MDLLHQLYIVWIHLGCLFLLQAWDDPRNPGATRARSGEEDVPRTGAGAAGRGPVIFGEFSVAAILVIVWI